MLNNFAATVLKGAFLYQVKTDPVTHLHLFFHTSVVWIILLHEKWMPLTHLVVCFAWWQCRGFLTPERMHTKYKLPQQQSSGQSDTVTKLALKWDEKFLCFFHTEIFHALLQKGKYTFVPQSKFCSLTPLSPHPTSQCLIRICKLKQA